MGARQNYYAESLGETTNTSAYPNATEKLALTFTPDASSDYYVMWSAGEAISVANATRRPQATLINKTSSVTYNDQSSRPRGVNDYLSRGGIFKETFGGSPASQTYEIDWGNTSGTADTVKIKEASIVAIKKGANDHDVDMGSTPRTTASTTFVDIPTSPATLTFTPGSTGDYLIIATAEGTVTSLATGDFGCQLLNSGTSTAYGVAHTSTQTTVGYGHWATAVKLNLAASSQTFKIQICQRGGGTTSVRNARIIALRLSDFDNAYYAEDRARTTVTSSTFTTRTTLAPTVIASDHLVIGTAVLDASSNSAANRFQWRLQEAGSTKHQKEETMQSATDRWHAAWGLHRSTLSAGTVTWLGQYANAGGVTTGIADSAIAVLQLGATPGGGTPVGVTLEAQWSVQQAVAKTCQAQWNVQAAIAKTLEARWNVSTSIAKTVEARWSVSTSATKTVQAQWSIQALASKALQGQWNVSALATKTLQAQWNVTTKATKALEPRWSVSTSAAKAVQAQWNVQAVVTKTLVAQWDVEEPVTAIGKTLEARWSVSTSAAKTVQAQWNVQALATKALAAQWTVSASASKSLQAQWNVSTKATKTVAAQWNVSAAIAKTVQAQWSVQAVIAKTVQAQWNVSATTAKALQAQWSVSTKATKAVQAQWSVQQAIAKTVQAQWSVSSKAAKAVEAQWSARALATKTFEAQWDVDATGIVVGKTLEAQWNVQKAAGASVQAVWNVSTKATKTTEARWNVQALAAKSVQAQWSVSTRTAKTLVAQWSVSTAAGKVLVAQWDVEAPTNIRGRATLTVTSAGAVLVISSAGASMAITSAGAALAIREPGAGLRHYKSANATLLVGV